MKLLLVRHGETDMNSSHMFVGHKDVELNALGKQQAERLRLRLKDEKIDAACCSDLKRAYLTAGIIVADRGVETIATPDLREIDYGEVDGMTFDEIKRCYPVLAQQCTTWSLELDFPGGESVSRLAERVNRFLEGLKHRSPQDTILIVSHGGALRFMLCAQLGMELKHWRQLRIDLASLSIVETYPDIAILDLLNDTSHLKGLV